MINIAERKAPSLARSFAKQILRKVPLLHLLEEESGSVGVLGEADVPPSGETVSEALWSKHPDAQGLNKEVLLLSDTCTSRHP